MRYDHATSKLFRTSLKGKPGVGRPAPTESKTPVGGVWDACPGDVPELSELTASAAFTAAAESPPPYPTHLRGRGIVIPGGGVRYFPCVWVNVSVLRHLGCDLPIELWHLGPEEITDEMRGLLAPLGVTCVNALNVRQQHPVRRLNGWELKCYALVHSSFEEALLLDADNVPVLDPTYLFDTEPYREHGAVFWPDYGRLPPDHMAWRLTGVRYRDEPEFESGQIVVDKRRCWGPLNLALWMNGHSDFWYLYVHGDKDTFHLAWRKLGLEYAMPATPLRPLLLPERRDGVMCQHDFDGRRVFQHRNFGKWSLDAVNPRVPGFLLEDLCLDLLERLRDGWRGWPGRPYHEREATGGQRRIAERLCSIVWLHRRVGRDQRAMTFSPDGTVARGAADHERTWRLDTVAGRPAVCILGRNGLTCVLMADGDRAWRGRWLIAERSAIDLIPTASPLLDTDLARYP